MDSIATDSGPGPAEYRVSTRDKMAITDSWLIISILGSMSILLGIGSEIRAAIFVVAMTVVHVLGYYAYKNQSNRGSGLSAAVAHSYWPALKTSLIEQGVIIVLAALMLDMGGSIHCAGLAFMAYWAMFLVIVCRRPACPTKLDLLLVRHGYIFMLAVIATAGPIWWKHVGRWD